MSLAITEHLQPMLRRWRE